MKKKTRTRYFPAFVLALVAVVLIAFAVFFVSPKRAESSSATPITGYLWSDTIGWISMSGTNYGVSIDSSGNLSGYAWSDNIGWIQFGGLSGFPSGSGTTAANAQIQSSGSLTGWARACAGMDDIAPNQWQPDNTCTDGYGDRTDGWDGWISLNGAGYGPSLSSGTFSGYGWGSTNVGWIDFEYASTSYDKCSSIAGYSCTGPGNQTITYTDSSCNQTPITTCVLPDYCSAGSSVCLVPPITVNSQLQVVPNLLQSGEMAVVSWNVSNATCSISGSNGDGPWIGASGSATTSPISGQTTYTLSCTGDSGSNPPSITQSVTVSVSPKFQER